MGRTTDHCSIIWLSQVVVAVAEVLIEVVVAELEDGEHLLEQLLVVILQVQLL